MGKPFQIIAAPFEIYLAPVGESFPDVDEAPSGNWVLVGTSGTQDMAEDGVVVVHDQNIEKVRSYGGTGPRKAFRTTEDLMVRFTLMDISIAEYVKALNFNTVTSVAAGSGTPGYDHANLYRGLDVEVRALLVKGAVSPLGAGWSMQYEVPYVFENGSPEPAYVKGQAAGLAFEFSALEDPDAASVAERFGRLVQQDADAL